MKVVFMGSDPIALPMLRHLAGSAGDVADITAIFTQPDRKAGRGMKVQPNPIKAWALEMGIDVHQPIKCGEAESIFIKEQGIDLVLVMAYGQILPSPFLKAPTLGALNFHASVLPRLRGASPIHSAVGIGLKETGVSLMRIIPALDAGPVADVERVGISPGDTSADVHKKLANACIPLIERCLPEIANGALGFFEQDAKSVTYCRIIEKTDAHLDFNASAQSLADRIRAFVPWPGTSFPYENLEIRVLEAVVVDRSDIGKPGTVLIEGDEVLIACGEGTLRLVRLQRPGGKPLPVADFLRGFPLSSGAILESREMRPLESLSPFPYRRRGNSGKSNT